MTTKPFICPVLAPPAPCWIVRATDAQVEILFVGHANRAELDAQIERIARWPWPFADTGGPDALADIHGDAIGVRLVRTLLSADEVADILVDLFGVELVAVASRIVRTCPTTPNRKI